MKEVPRINIVLGLGGGLRGHNRVLGGHIHRTLEACGWRKLAGV
ncbi:MAG: hypothetical protein ACE5OY_07330 [Candidatus Bathyarchaeia archaeon]